MCNLMPEGVIRWSSFLIKLVVQYSRSGVDGKNSGDKIKKRD
jgi:hypothetical protein